MRIRLALIFLMLYEISIVYSKLDKFLVLKVAAAGLAYLSLFLIIWQYLVDKVRLKNEFSKPIVYIIVILCLWNLFQVFRNLFDGEVLTLFGNRNTALAMFLPIFIGLGLRFNYFVQIKKTFLLFAFAGLGLFVISFGNENFLNIYYVFLLPVFYLILITEYNFSKLILLWISGLLFFNLAYEQTMRTAMYRVIGSIIVLIFFTYVKKINLLFKSFFILIILTPFLVLSLNIINGESIFRVLEDKGALVSGKAVKTDTRSFLYEELLSDLSFKNNLLLGRGALGRYYSKYFESIQDSDSSSRLNVEVGFLSMILKGGVVSVILNYILLISAIVGGLFYSRNLLVKKLSCLLLLHYLLLFIEDIPQFSLYNLIIWSFIGFCLSKSMRAMSDKDIKYRLKKIF